jgi:predicted enzyme related to lactoylglutathione lyase
MTRITMSFAGAPVADYEAAIAWYERLFGRAPDVYVKEDEAMWQAADAGWVYVVADPERAGNALLAVLVDDLDTHVAELAGRGIDAGPIDARPGTTRRVVLTDPDGNRITVGEDPSPRR